MTEEGLGGDTELETDMEELVHEVEFEEPEFQDTLATIADAVATKAALLEDPTFSDQVGTAKGGPGRRWTFGWVRPRTNRESHAIGRSRFLEGQHHEAPTRRQLDFFKIELGVLFPGNRVEYARNVSKDLIRIQRSRGPADEEKRYYLTWAEGRTT